MVEFKHQKCSLRGNNIMYFEMNNEQGKIKGEQQQQVLTDVFFCVSLVKETKIFNEIADSHLVLLLKSCDELT